MFKLFISQRYLQSRMFSYVSVIGLAMGVALLVVVNSVMGGFSVEFQDRIRGTLSHLVVEGIGDGHMRQGAQAMKVLQYGQLMLQPIPVDPLSQQLDWTSPSWDIDSVAYHKFIAGIDHNLSAMNHFGDRGEVVAKQPFAAGRSLGQTAEHLTWVLPEGDTLRGEPVRGETLRIPLEFVASASASPVEHLSPYLQRQCIAVSGSNQDGALLRGIQPELEARTNKFRSFLQAPADSYEEAYSEELGDPQFGLVYGGNTLLYSLFRLGRIDASTYAELEAEAETPGALRGYAQHLGFADQLVGPSEQWVASGQLSAAQMKICRDYQRVLGGQGLRAVERGLGSLDELAALTRAALPDEALPGLFERTVSGRPGVVVGIDLFRYLGLRIGDAMTVTTYKTVADKEEPVDRKFEVVGAYGSGFSDIDRHFVYADLDALQELLETDVLTGVNISVADFENVETISDQLERQLFAYYLSERLFVQTWKQRNPFLLEAVGMQRFLISMIIFFMMLLAGVVLLVILLMLVNEKIRDIGILKAVGATTSGVLYTFLFQGFLIGLAGSCIGVLGGIVFSQNINSIAGVLETVTGFDVFPKEVYFLDHIPVLIDPWEIAVITIPTVFISLALSVYPAYRASKLHPLDALRCE